MNVIQFHTDEISGNIQRDLLAAYTSIDYRIFTELPPEDADHLFRRLLIRLSSLCFYHDDHNPPEFLQELNNASQSNAFTIANNFLETGHSTLTPDEQKIVASKELQQEMLHTSRIADTEFSNDKSIKIHNRRLRKTNAIPISLKALTEMMTIARSRFLQRGKDLLLPKARRPGAIRRHLGSQYFVQTAKDPSDYLLFVQSPKKSLRRNIGFYFENLLSYLTPSEATIALAAYLSETHTKRDITIQVFTMSEHNDIQVIHWTKKANTIFTDAISWCKAHLPVIQRIPIQVATTSINEFVQLFFHDEHTITVQVLPLTDGMQLKLFHQEKPYSFQLIPYTVDSRTKVDEMVATATQKADTAIKDDILTLECGHIHLNQKMDLDQEVGIKIGANLYHTLTKHQQSPPRLTPMIDDEHVIAIQLSPKEYLDFFSENNQTNHHAFELIPESSPIIRAITTSLFGRLKNSELHQSLERRGGNLYLKLDQQISCELFEDFEGRCENSCVFFEVALLLYRSAIKTFSEYVHNRFHLDEDIHEKMFSILNSNQIFAVKMRSMQELHQTFFEITNPHQPDTAFYQLLDGVIDQAKTPYVHVNVLEDHYEIQQQKVRMMIDALRLPIKLYTVHFNTSTGHIFVDH